MEEFVSLLRWKPNFGDEADARRPAPIGVDTRRTSGERATGGTDARRVGTGLGSVGDRTVATSPAPAASTFPPPSAFPPAEPVREQAPRPPRSPVLAYVGITALILLLIGGLYAASRLLPGPGRRRRRSQTSFSSRTRRSPCRSCPWRRSDHYSQWPVPGGAGLPQSEGRAVPGTIRRAGGHDCERSNLVRGRRFSLGAARSISHPAKSASRFRGLPRSRSARLRSMVFRSPATTRTRSFIVDYAAPASSAFRGSARAPFRARVFTGCGGKGFTGAKAVRTSPP